MDPGVLRERSLLARVGPGAAVGLLLFLLYARGACPTMYVGDSGELVTAVDLLGIPHPTGYPLYVLLGKLWTLALPAGSVAWRMSLFSAAAAAAACAALYGLCRTLGLGAIAGLVGALLLAFAPSFWGEANVQRTYSLGALFVVLATAAAVRWERRRDGWSLAAAFALCGLGATNHSFMVFYAVALGAFVVLVDPAVLRRPRQLAAAGGAFAAGLLPYLYLPVRSRMNPRLDWGDPETLGRFLDVVLRRDFWQRKWIEQPADLLPIAGDYLGSFASELTWAGAALAVLGLAAARRRGWPAALLLLVMGVNVGALALHGSRSDLFIWHRYYIPSYAMAALLAGLGCQLLVERLPRRTGLVALAVPLFVLATGWRTFDRSRYRIAEDFSDAVLRALPPGAHLIATDDNILFVLMYLHLVEGRRPDVDLILQGVGGANLPPLRFDPETEPLFFTHHPNWRLPTLDVVPVGVVFQAWRRGDPPPPNVLPTLELDGEHDPGVPKDYLTQNLIGHFHYMLGVTFEESDWPRARREFSAAMLASPDNDVLFYNLGLIFARNGLYEDALAAFRRADELNPRHLASLSRPRPSDRVAEAAAELDRVAGLRAALVAEDGVLRGADPATAAYHRALATLLEARGEPLAARGARLRALELEAGP
jgi:tetratricopeptide (TPR) repeat protein